MPVPMRGGIEVVPGLAAPKRGRHLIDAGDVSFDRRSPALAENPGLFPRGQRPAEPSGEQRQRAGIVDKAALVAQQRRPRITPEPAA